MQVRELHELVVLDLTGIFSTIIRLYCALDNYSLVRLICWRQSSLCLLRNIVKHELLDKIKQAGRKQT